MKAVAHSLDHTCTHPDAEIIHRASEMILHADTDAAHLAAPEARSHAGGCHHLSGTNGETFNGPVLPSAKAIKNTMALAVEAELGALCLNGQEAVALQNCLEAMGHPQPATPMKTDNSTANGIVDNTMKQKKSKVIDMRFHWL